MCHVPPHRPSATHVGPVLNGHVHTNFVSERTTAFGSGSAGGPIEVVTTSSVGCRILWNGSTSVSLSPALARAVASQATGGDAFVNYVIRNGPNSGPEDPSLAAERVAARPDLSGLRLFEFDASKGYRHQFFSLEELDLLDAPLVTEDNASPLGHLPFTAWG